MVVSPKNLFAVLFYFSVPNKELEATCMPIRQNWKFVESVRFSEGAEQMLSELPEALGSLSEKHPALFVVAMRLTSSREIKGKGHEISQAQVPNREAVTSSLRSA